MATPVGLLLALVCAAMSSVGAAQIRGGNLMFTSYKAPYELKFTDRAGVSRGVVALPEAAGRPLASALSGSKYAFTLMADGPKAAAKSIARLVVTDISHTSGPKVMHTLRVPGIGAKCGAGGVLGAAYQDFALGNSAIAVGRTSDAGNVAIHMPVDCMGTCQFCGGETCHAGTDVTKTTLNKYIYTPGMNIKLHLVNSTVIRKLKNSQDDCQSDTGVSIVAMSVLGGRLYAFTKTGAGFYDTPIAAGVLEGGVLKKTANLGYIGDISCRAWATISRAAAATMCQDPQDRKPFGGTQPARVMLRLDAGKRPLSYPGTFTDSRRNYDDIVSVDAVPQNVKMYALRTAGKTVLQSQATVLEVPKQRGATAKALFKVSSRYQEVDVVPP